MESIVLIEQPTDFTTNEAFLTDKTEAISKNSCRSATSTFSVSEAALTNPQLTITEAAPSSELTSPRKEPSKTASITVTLKADIEDDDEVSEKPRAKARSALNVQKGKTVAPLPHEASTSPEIKIKASSSGAVSVFPNVNISARHQTLSSHHRLRIRTNLQSQELL